MSARGGTVIKPVIRRDTTLPPATEQSAVAVLEHLAESLGLPFEAAEAVQAYRAATRSVEPTHPRAARIRLMRAAETVGIQLQHRNLSVREALQLAAEGVPLAIFAVTPQGVAQWFVLVESDGRRGRLVTPQAEGLSGELWLSATEMAQTIGAGSPDVVLEWYTATAAVPMEEASAAYVAHKDEIHFTAIPPWRRLLGLLRPEVSDIRLVALFAVVHGILYLSVPVVVMAVVNTVAFGTLIQQLIILCLGLLIALALASVLNALQTLVVEYIQRRIFARVATDLAYRLPRVEISAFDGRNGPELVNRFFDVLTVQKSAATLLLEGVTVVLQILIGLSLLAFYHRLLLGFDIALIVGLIILTGVLSRSAVRRAGRESIIKYRVAGWMEEIARHQVAFKLAGGPQLAWDRADTLTRDYLEARRDYFRVVFRQVLFALFMQVFANVGLLAIGGALVIRGELTLGELVAAEIVISLIVASYVKFVKQLEATYDLLAATEKLGQLLDLPLERDSGEYHIGQTAGAAVTFHNVTFSYSRQREPALHQLNLTIRPGERVALVGPNGAGKSTLIDVLFGLRIPQSGWVEIDGVDLRSLRRESLREHIALVKGIEVIEGTILDNIRMGREHISLTEIRETLRQVGLLDTILALPDGLETVLWGDGKPLSLGQANRLMVARAIVGQPRLLILDEALDHMDADIRKTVIPALFGPNAHWTLLIVTHSEEVAALCDRVITLHAPKYGGIVDDRLTQRGDLARANAGHSPGTDTP